MQALQLELELADDSLNDELDMILKGVSAEAKEEMSKNGGMGAEKRLHLIQKTLIAGMRRLRLEQPLYIILDGIVWEQEQRQLVVQLVKLVLELHDEPNLNMSRHSKVPIKVLAVAKYDQWPEMVLECRKEMERAFSHRLMDLKGSILYDLALHQEDA